MQRINCDHDGNTPLHHLVKNAANAHDLAAALKKLNDDELKSMARKYNNNGHLPIHLLPAFSSPDIKKENEAFDLLFNAMTDNIPNLNEPIDWEAIKTNYQPDTDSKLYENLKIGCEIANQIRSFILYSSTHPQMSGHDAKQAKFICSCIVQNRRETLRRRFEFLHKNENIQFYKTKKNDDDCKLRCDLSDALYLKLIQIEASVTMQQQQGDCGDIADVVKYFFLLRGHELEILQLQNGDHVFDVMGRNKESDINNYLTWGEEAVVIDAWAGKVYPAKDLPNQLKNYECFMRNNVYYSAIPPYDPEFHELEQCIFLPKKKLKGYADILPDTFSRKFVQKFSQDLSEKELYIFNEYICRTLNKFMKKNLVTEKELTELHYPKETLLYALLNKNRHYALLYKKTTLKFIEENFIKPKMARQNHTLFTNDSVSHAVSEEKKTQTLSLSS